LAEIPAGDPDGRRSIRCSDALKGPQIRVSHASDRGGCVCDAFGRIPICANLEGVLAFDLEQIADLGEHAGYGKVIQSGSEESMTRD
jgi:hypothetical protein